MTFNEVNELYFDWLYDVVTRERFHKKITYKKVLRLLHDIDFRYSIPRDENRAYDGLDMRYEFATENGFDEYPYGKYPPEGGIYAIEVLEEKPCSVLEMMIGLSVRCEENIMDDPRFGDRTNQWFWNMITNLGLGSMDDDHFDLKKATHIIDIFLDREYSPDGKGGLFRIRHCKEDLRDVEIWYQLNWYLNELN